MVSGSWLIKLKRICFLVQVCVIKPICSCCGHTYVQAPAFDFFLFFFFLFLGLDQISWSKYHNELKSTQHETRHTDRALFSLQCFRVFGLRNRIFNCSFCSRPNSEFPISPDSYHTYTLLGKRFLCAFWSSCKIQMMLYFETLWQDQIGL